VLPLMRVWLIRSAGPFWSGCSFLNQVMFGSGLPPCETQLSWCSSPSRAGPCPWGALMVGGWGGTVRVGVAEWVGGRDG